MFSKTKIRNITENSYYSNGYAETISRGINGVRRFRSGIITETAKGIDELKKELDMADAVVIGAGAGLSTSAGFTYSGERFEYWFHDFREKFGFTDMYSGGFYPFSSEEEKWAFWSRNIYVNRYMAPAYPVYDRLYELIKDKDYFVITTNVDHCFQKAGFDRKRFFYTQGDYGLFQSTNALNKKTYDNEEWVKKAMAAQGFVINEEGYFEVPGDGKLLTAVPSELLPRCPDDGYPFTTNLRVDDSFAEDEGWHRASNSYAEFLRRHENMRVLFLELGVGANTPVIIKYPFWQMANDNDQAVYCCINYHEAYAPKQLEDKSIIINGDIGVVLAQLIK